MLIYFSDAIVAPSQVDPSQWASVISFREKVGGLGLFWTYGSTDEFSDQFRIHLAKLIRDRADIWRDQVTVSHSLAPDAVVRSNDDNDVAALGLLDLIEIGTDGFERVTEISKRMVGSVEQVGKDLATRTTELNEIGTPTSRDEMTRAKSIVNRAGLDMLSFVRKMDEDIPAFSSAYSTAIDCYGKAAGLIPEFKGDHREMLADAHQTVIGLVEAMSRARESMKGLRGSIGDFPPVTTILLRAKQKTLTCLDSLISEFDRAISLSGEVADLMGKLAE
jgi:hypothetical protein